MPVEEDGGLRRHRYKANTKTLEVNRADFDRRLLARLYVRRALGVATHVRN